MSVVAESASAPVVSARFDDPEWVHEEIVKLHRDHNSTHVRLLLLLDHVHRNSFHLRLGYASIEHYMVQHLHLKRSTAYEYLRVGRALARLPALRVAYESGRIGYSQLRDISRIAEPDTQEAWLGRADEVTAEQLHFEVRDAVEKGRREPSDDRRGLPNLMMEVKFRCNLEEREMVSKVVQMLREEIRGSKRSEEGDEVEVSFDEAVLHLFRRAFESGGTLAGEADTGGRTPYSMVYRQCPDCSESTVQTDAGTVRVEPARVASLEGEAKRVEIRPGEEEPLNELPAGALDRTNSVTLARKVIGRDGDRCSNPGCGRRTHLHAHHIRFRSRGGRTAMFNETTVCAVCHALIHGGVLEVEGDPKTGLTWRARADRVDIPVERMAPESTVQTLRVAAAESAVRTGTAEGSEWGHLRRVLVQLGWSQRDARERVRVAVRELEAVGPRESKQETEQWILKRAMAR